MGPRSSNLHIGGMDMLTASFRWQPALQWQLGAFQDLTFSQMCKMVSLDDGGTYRQAL